MKRHRHISPFLLKTSILPMPYHHFCASCKREVGTSSHINDNPQPIYCTVCKKAMREGIAA